MRQPTSSYQQGASSIEKAPLRARSQAEVALVPGRQPALGVSRKMPAATLAVRKELPGKKDLVYQGSELLADHLQDSQESGRSAFSKVLQPAL